MGSADLSDVTSDAQLEELRKIRLLLEIIASSREWEKKAIIVGDMLGLHYAKDIEEALRQYPDWEVENSLYVQNRRTAGEMPNGCGLVIFLRRGKRVVYPTHIVNVLSKSIHLRGEAAAEVSAIPERVPNIVQTPHGLLGEATVGEGPQSLVDKDDFSQPMLKIDDACERFSIRRPVMMKAINDGSLPSKKIAPESPNPLGHAYTYRLRLPDVERWHREIYSKLPPPKRGRPAKR